MARNLERVFLTKWLRKHDDCDVRGCKTLRGLLLNQTNLEVGVGWLLGVVPLPLVLIHTVVPSSAGGVSSVRQSLIAIFTCSLNFDGRIASLYDLERALKHFTSHSTCCALCDRPFENTNVVVSSRVLFFFLGGNAISTCRVEFPRDPMREPGPDEHMRQAGGFQRLMAATTFESPFAKKKKKKLGIDYSPLELDEVRSLPLLMLWLVIAGIAVKRWVIYCPLRVVRRHMKDFSICLRCVVRLGYY